MTAIRDLGDVWRAKRRPWYKVAPQALLYRSRAGRYAHEVAWTQAICELYEERSRPEAEYVWKVYRDQYEANWL